MSTPTGRNIEFPIYKDVNGVQVPLHNLVLHKATYDSQVMSLGDKITGDVYYPNNHLQVSMDEYIVYNDVKFMLVNPPTVVREGLVSDNGDLKGMTRYSFEFFHPMYMLLNFSFSDVAVTDYEKAYLSENKKFSWIGDARDYVAKLNKNLESTEWVVRISDALYDDGTPKPEITTLSEVLQFDNNSIGDALKTFYDTYDIPFVIDKLDTDDEDYPTKKFLILIGLPTEEIQGVKIDQDVITTAYDEDEDIGYSPIPYMLDEGDTITVTLNSGSSGIPTLLTSSLRNINTSTYTAIQPIELFAATENRNDQSVHVVVEGRFVFKFGQGVGLKNNSRTPKNNKIVTRLSGYGSEDNIPYGYPQIVWTGDQTWNFTINNQSGVQDVTIGGETVRAMSYPIYEGIVGGQLVKLIKHPFTRTHLMPSIYVERVNDKVNPNAEHFDPRTELVDYYDADGGDYPHPINLTAPSYEIHEFEKIKPQLGEASIINTEAWNVEGTDYVTISAWYSMLGGLIMNARDNHRVGVELSFLESLQRHTSPNEHFYDGYSWGTHLENGGYVADAVVRADNYFLKVDASSPWLVASNKKILYASAPPEAVWDDTMDDNGEYVQSYFKITLPQLSFDVYACASLTQEMNIVMRSGSCIGCTFPIQVDWDDYKKNFYDEDGNFAPDGDQRDYDKYPDSSIGQIEVIVQKDLNTFGTLMPDTYRTPVSGDKFVITGISLPTSYITNAEQELDDAMKEYMLENNVYYYDYPLKFDQYFLATHTNALAKIRNNTVVRFQYGNEPPMALYIKQVSIKYGDEVLPQYDITLTDDVEITLNQIGQTTEDVSKLRLQISELQKYYGSGTETNVVSPNLLQELSSKLSKIADDVARGRITFERGIESLAPAVFAANIGSSGFVKGMEQGAGWNVDELGNAEFESLRVRSALQVTQLLLNRIQAQEGDTVFSDNDEIDAVTPEYKQVPRPYSSYANPSTSGWYEAHIDAETGEITYTASTDTRPNNSKNYYTIETYLLTFVAKWNGYFTSQMYGNILKGRINTLAANEMNVSDVTESECVEQDGMNKYFTSWMRVVDTRNTDDDILNNQVRVVLYDDNDTPSNKNFAPCPRMIVYRFGHIIYNGADQEKYDAEGYTTRESAQNAINQRQSTFALSTTDGRIQKLIGVRTPKLQYYNYGVTIGKVPDFLYQDPMVEARLVEGGDYLYAQGVIVSDFIKCDVDGAPITNYFDKGEWNSSTRYLANDWSSTNLQYQTDEVWHNGQKWRCTATNNNHEPNENSNYWELLLASGNDGVTPQFIFKASNAEPATPATTQDDSAPSGWSTAPQSVSATISNCWVCSRTKDNGVWSAFTTPALYSHYAQDGTSFMVKGSAIAVIDEGGNVPTATSVGDIYLYNKRDSSGGFDVFTWNGTNWIGSNANEGDAYVYDGDLWVNTAPTFWDNVGRIKGDDGINSVHAFLDNENDTMLYSTDSSTASPISGNIVSRAYLYDGNEEKTNSTTWSIAAPSGEVARLNCTASISGNVITVTKMSNTSGHVYVRGTYNGNYYFTKLTLKKIIDTDKYDIICVPTSLSYNVTENYPTTADVTISCYKTSVTGERQPSAPPTDYYLSLVGIANDGSTNVLLGYVQTANTLTIQNVPLSNYASLRAFVADSPVLVTNEQYSAATDFYDYQTISINKAANGSSTWIADLTNEMDAVACDNNGNVLVLNPLQSVSTTVSLWYGATRKGFTIAMKKGNTAYSQSGATVGHVTATWNNTSGVITLTYNSGATISTSDVYEITMTSTDDNTISRVLKLTVSGVRSGEDGSFEIYQLHPTLDAVSVTPSGVPSREGFITNLTKRTQDGITDVYRNSLPSGFEIRYTINVDTQTKSNQLLYAASGSSACQEMWYDFDDNQFVTTEPTDGTIIVSNTNTNGAINVLGVLRVPSSVTYMVFYLWDGDTLLDVENIPFTKDGTDGHDGVSPMLLHLDNENDTMLYKINAANGNEVLVSGVTSQATLYYGQTPLSSGVTWQCVSSQTNGQDDCTATITQGGLVTVTAMKTLTAYVEVQAIYNSNVYKKKLTLLKSSDEKYNAIPSVTAITYNTSTRTPSTQIVSVSCYKTSIDGETALSKLPKGYYMAIVGINRGTTTTYTTLNYTGNPSSPSAYNTIQATVPLATYDDIVVFIADDYRYDQATILYDSQEVSIIKVSNGTDGDDGASAWAADLTNEMDAVSCDEGNRIIAQQTLNTTAKLYYGATEISSTISIKNKNGTTMTSGTAVAGVTATWDNSTGAITFTYSTNAVVSDKDTYTITISSTGASPISRELVFTVKGVVGDVYNLDPSLDKLVFSANAAGDALTPSSLSVYCSNTKRNLDGSVTLNIGTNRNNLWKNGGARYNTMYRYITGSTIGSWLWCKDLTNGTLTINSSDSYTGIEFCLTDANDRPEITDANIIDREVVPIIKHGLKGDTGDTGKGIQSTVIRYAVSATSGTTPPSSGWQASIPSINEGEYLWTRTTITYTDGTTSISYSVTKYGESAASYDVIVDSAHIIVDAMGNLTANLEAHVLKAFRGSVTTDTTANALSLTFNNTSVSWTTQSSGTYTLTNYTNTWSTLGNPTNALLAFRVNNVVVASASVPITLMGKMGRTLYYAGDYNELVRDEETFSVTDFEAPYVSYVDSGITRYKVWVGDNVTDVAYSSYPVSGAYWEVMTNDFKYLISEAVFSDFAKLGSAVFNKDYMFSQWGTEGNLQSSNYAQTNPYFFESDTYVALNGTLQVKSNATAGDNPLLIGNLYVQQGHTYTLSVNGTTTSGLLKVRLFDSTSWNLTECEITSSHSQDTSSWQATKTGFVSIGTYQSGTNITGTLTYVTVTEGNWAKTFTPNLAIDLFKGNIRAYNGFFKNVTIEGMLNNLVTNIFDTSDANKSAQLCGSAEFVNAYKPIPALTEYYSLDVLSVGDVVNINSCRHDVFLPCFFQCDGDPYYCRTSTNYGGYEHLMTSTEMYQLIGKRISIFIKPSLGAHYIWSPQIDGLGWGKPIASENVYNVTGSSEGFIFTAVQANQSNIIDVEYVCADCVMVIGSDEIQGRGIFPLVSHRNLALSTLDEYWT